MTDAFQTPQSAAIVAIARGLATARAPGAQLPCPVCATTQRGDGLERHLATDHHASLQSAATDAVPCLTWTGADKRVLGPSFVPLILLVVGPVLFIAFGGQIDIDSPWFLWTFFGWTWFSLAAIVIASMDLLRATLTFDGDTLRLRHTLGLRQVVVHFPATLESGLLRASVSLSSGSDEYNSGIEVDFGPYLRLSNGRSAIVIGCKGEHELVHHGDPRGWQRAPPRKRWSITLDPVSFVAFEYALAGRRMLSPRQG